MSSFYLRFGILFHYVIKYLKIILGGMRMFKGRIFYSFFIAILILSFGIFTGCAKPPAEEMAKADKAIGDAQQKEAPLYVPDLFAKAEASFKTAKDYVEGKKYKEAKQAAIEAEANAQQAIAGIEAAKAKIKADADKLVQDIQKSIDDLKAAIATVAKKKALAKTLEPTKEIISKWETDLAGVKEKLQGQKIKEASDELKALNDQVNVKKDETTNLISPAPASPAPAPKKP
jgi:maltodextrin utilization protein YvdJ